MLICYLKHFSFLFFKNVDDGALKRTRENMKLGGYAGTWGRSKWSRVMIKIIYMEFSEN